MIRVSLLVMMFALTLYSSAIAQSTRLATMPTTQQAMPVESPAPEAAAVVQQFMMGMTPQAREARASLAPWAESKRLRME